MTDDQRRAAVARLKRDPTALYTAPRDSVRLTQEQLALPPSDPSRSSGPLVEVVKDNKGIYTLKSGGSDKAEKPAATSSGASKAATAEPADRA